MKSFVAAIALTTVAFLTCGSPAKEGTGGSAQTPVLLLSEIGAHDPRIRVDPNAVPWRAVGKLQAASLNLRELCTATLVGPSTVVTAAHCMLNHRTQRYFPPESLHFLIGYDGNRYAGHAVGIRVQIGDGYDPRRPKETIGRDWALVTLDKGIGSEDRVLPIVSDLPEDGAIVMLGGYQQDHPLVLMADTQCRIDGRFIDESGRLLLRHNCAGTHGVSGAPLLINKDGRWQIAAIEVAGETGNEHGAAVLIDEAIKNFRTMNMRST
jgi:protease YdgD